MGEADGGVARAGVGGDGPPAGVGNDAPSGAKPEPAIPPVAPSSAEEERDSDTPQATAVIDIDLDKLDSVWPAVIDQVRQSGSLVLSQILSAARPVAVNVEEAVLDVGFPTSAAFNKRKAEATDARDRLAEAVKTIVGERLRPVYVLLDSEADSPTGERKLSEDELFELMRTEFDAEEDLSEPDDGPDEAQAKEA
jgi:hypothetical protein